MDEIRFIDLFSGIGGFRLGLENCGGSQPYREDSRSEGNFLDGVGGEDEHSSSCYFRCVWSCDNNKYANQVYTKNFGEENHYSDDIQGVNTETIPDFNLLCAGFPCQAFSIAGKRKGFKDTHGTLFFEILRVAEAKRPHLLLLENVKGLLNHDRGRTFTVILQSLDELGYWVEWQVLNSKHFGVPQNRERVFIIGHLRGTGGREVFPIGETDISAYEAAGDEDSDLASTVTAGYGKQNMRGSYLRSMPVSTAIDSNLNAEGGGVGAKTGLYAVPVLTPDRLKKRQHGRRFKEDGDPSFTLTGQDVHGVAIANTVDTSGWLRQMGRHEEGKHGLTDYRIRRLTPVECERLQGFPDGWTESVSDTQRYKCLGNAVTVNVIEFLGRLIRSSLRTSNNKG